MRIIDKNNDYYDYLQDSTDTLVFDRRNSFLLSKEEFCNNLRGSDWLAKHADSRIVLFQCGGTYWLFLITITEKTYNDFPSDYKMELITTWKNYDKPLELLKIDNIGITNLKLYEYVGLGKYSDYSKIKNHIDDIKSFVDHNEYKVIHNMNYHTVSTSNKNEFDMKVQTFPILRACGIALLVDPVEIFCAIEEYFSLKKTAAERIDPIGATNGDKIIMHGFDTKTSFRHPVK